MIRPASDSAAVAADLITGTVERVTFHNPENGFSVLKVKVRGRGDPVTVVGSTPAVNVGEMMSAEGQWANDRTHGLQFKASILSVAPPASKAGMEKYLASGAIKGLGIATAEKIVARFGKNTFDILDNEPHRLSEIPGLTQARIKRIAESWQEDRIVRDIGLFLQDHGLGPGQALRVYRALGKNAIGLIRDDPYRLSREVRGFGFRTADAVGRALGLSLDAPQRVKAGLTFALNELTDEGHCGYETGETIALAARLLEVSEDKVQAVTAEEIALKHITQDDIGGVPHLFLPLLHRAEKQIAERIQLLAQGRPPYAIRDLDAAITRAEKATSKTLAPSQRAALETMISAKVAVITGGPGVGKTTLLATLLHLVQSEETKVILTAPTGRAAKRMSEQTGLEAKTIHRLLEIDPDHGGFRRGRDKALDADLVVVDETSMVDVPLMLALLEAVPLEAALLFVGDVDQLPPVGPGQALSDIINSGAVPVARLTEVFRQAASSRIISNAHRINQGELPLLPEPGEDSDYFHVEMRDPEDGVAKIIAMVKERIPKRFGLDPIRDVQVLAPMNKGVLGARNLTIALQKALNPSRMGSVERYGWNFAAGDRVMQTVNDYDRDVFNGDLGTVLRIDSEEEELLVSFDGRSVPYSFSDLEALVPAYAITIHKSQGSEYPAVIVPFAMGHYAMLAKNLLYTAITRGKGLVVTVGEQRAIQMAIKGGVRSRPRITKLREWLAPVR